MMQYGFKYLLQIENGGDVWVLIVARAELDKDPTDCCCRSVGQKIL
jgi:hypothetical protein